MAIVGQPPPVGTPIALPGAGAAAPQAPAQPAAPAIPPELAGLGSNLRWNPATGSWTNSAAQAPTQAPAPASSTPNPWLTSVGGTLNGAPAPFAAPGAPNVNYITEEAARNLGSAYGANVRPQDTTNMASPGSTAPSAPMYGLDFGRGDVQNAGQIEFWRQRGDREEDIRARINAGVNNTGWGGQAPATASNNASYTAPIATNRGASAVAPVAQPRTASAGASASVGPNAMGPTGSAGPSMAQLAPLLAQLMQYIQRGEIQPAQLAQLFGVGPR